MRHLTLMMNIYERQIVFPSHAFRPVEFELDLQNLHQSFIQGGSMMAGGFQTLGSDTKAQLRNRALLVVERSNLATGI